MSAASPYEKSDVTIRGIVWFTVILAVGSAATMLLMAWMFSDLEGRRVRADEASAPRTMLKKMQPEHPPQPILQGSPGSNFELQSPLLEMEFWDRKMDEQLTTAGWVDRNANRVRIPIERAKELLLERGLPVRSPAATEGDER